MEDDRETVCSLCAVGCRLAPGAEGSRAVGREGPVNTGGRLCRKGIHALERIPDDERLTTPLVRRDGSLEPASWTAAYDRVVSGIERAVERHGPDALAFLGAPHSTTEENYLLGKLARTLGTNNVDNRARLCHVSSARALSDRLGWPASTNDRSTPPASSTAAHSRSSTSPSVSGRGARWASASRVVSLPTGST